MKSKPMRIFFSLFFVVALATFSCKKDNYNPPLPNPPNLYSSNCFILSEQNDTIRTEYEYSVSNKLLSINTYFNDVLYEKISYIYQSNFVTVTSSQTPYIYKYFLNRKGLADSVAITYVGNIYLKKYFVFDGNGLPLQITTRGIVISQPYEEITYNEYVNNNIVKSRTIIDGVESITSFEYYLDSVNTLGATDQAKSFIRQGNNLLKKVLYDDDSFLEYTYTKDEKGNWLVSTLNQNDEIVQNTLNLSCN